jgi:hypothetical protein
MSFNRDPPATAGALNFSGTAEADGHFSRFDDNRYLAPAVGKLQHSLKSLFVLEHIQICKRDLAARKGLPGRGRVRSKILAKNYDFVVHFAPIVAGARWLLSMFIKIGARRLNCK